MQVHSRNTKLEKQLTKESELQTTHGPHRAKLIKRRLTEMEASDNLAILKTLPGPRLHSLVGNRAGELSVDLDHPYRLLFKPDNNPLPMLASGGLDFNAVTSITILEIADTHE